MGGSGYSSNLPKPENRYSSKGIPPHLHETSASTSNLGEKRSYSQTSLGSVGTYQPPSKLSKSDWGSNAPKTSDPVTLPTAQSAQNSGWNSSTFAQPQMASVTDTQAAGNMSWANPSSCSRMLVTGSSRPSYNQPPPVAGIATNSYQVPPPPPPPPPQTGVPQSSKQSSSIYLNQQAPPVGFAQYMSQAPPGYPHVPPQTWVHGAWHPTQQYPGF